MKYLEALLKSRTESQVYLWKANAQVDIISKWVNQWEFRFFYINGRIVTDTESFFEQAKSVMEFPFFRSNWNALYDCVHDLSWFTEKSYVLLYDQFQRFAHSEPDEFAILLDVLRHAVEFHRTRKPDNRFYILLRGDTQFISSEIPILGNE